MFRPMILKLSVTALVLGMVTGCATTQQLEQMEADIASAKEQAAAAVAAANEAKSAAALADNKAEAAMDAANTAQATADDCTERCDRIMRKTMRK